MSYTLSKHLVLNKVPHSVQYLENYSWVLCSYFHTFTSSHSYIVNMDQVKCHWLCSYLQKLFQMTLLNNTLLLMPFWYLLCGGIFHQIRFSSSSQNSNVCFVEAPRPHCTSCHLTLALLLTRTSQFAFLSLFLSLYQ